MLLFLLIVLAGLPYVYGRHAFDLQLRPVSALPGGADASGTFVFAEPDSILVRVAPSDTSFTIILYRGSGYLAASSAESLAAASWRAFTNVCSLPGGTVPDATDFPLGGLPDHKVD